MIKSCKSSKVVAQRKLPAVWLGAAMLASLTVAVAAEKSAAPPNIVIILTDNQGYADVGCFGAKGFVTPKGTAWEGGTRTPCVMRWPGKISGGKVCDDMFMSIDLFPTIAKLIGAKLPEHPIDGLDVWPLISGQPGAKNPHPAYWFYYERGQLQALTTGDGRWKLQLPHSYGSLDGKPAGKDGIPASQVSVKIPANELYDLVNDVSEKTNVISQHPDIVQLLEAEAEKARVELGDALTKREGKGVREPGKTAKPADAKKSAQTQRPGNTETCSRTDSS